MIPELAHLAATVGLVSAVVLCGAGHYGAFKRDTGWLNACRSVAILQFGALLLSFALLAYCFSVDDFSVMYVANNSNLLLPWYYKLFAVIGAHEGSFLWYTLVLAGWTTAVALAGKALSIDIHGHVLGTLGFINVVFLLFLLISSNPFERLVPHVPTDGSDLNVILQDFALIVHPPLLMIGYIGFSVAFAFAIAALLTGRFDAAWARWTRPWTNLAWAFLTIGVALGSWWAYYELGWGGWWFWDPVENVSFMPWLAGTALVHSLAVTEKRGAFKTWTVLLALITFTLCLLGAFLVRSGVLTSVHAFALDPERGMFLLLICLLLGGGGFLLYAFRATTLRSRAQYEGISRELLLLINNALLVLAVTTILIYTLYPIPYEWFSGGERISIGPPYFNRVFVPLMLVLTLCLTFAPIARWKRTPMKLVRGGAIVLGASALAALVLSVGFLSTFHLGVLLALTLAIGVLTSHVRELYRRRYSFSLSFVGMCAAHMGFAVTVIGVAVTSAYSVATDVRVAPGAEISLAGRTYYFADLAEVIGPNYRGHRGTFVSENLVLQPERRFYTTQEIVTTEAGIAPGFLSDHLATLGEPLPNGTWGVRIQEKPLVRWIWLGALLIALGGVVALLDARYRRVISRPTLPHSPVVQTTG